MVRFGSILQLLTASCALLGQSIGFAPNPTMADRCGVCRSGSSSSSPAPSRRSFLNSGGWLATAGATAAILTVNPLASYATIDVNNCLAGDFQKYPGLFPTISAKIIKQGPFKNPEEMYAAMESEPIVARLKAYEKEFTFGRKEGGDRGSGKRSI
mmetsp:Transcript_73605/g.148248  ORF Transcript_73605/g.148248 Transcript_73605/m.148248 type:complete len:155 (-) Transcript_73605:290-754(-)